MDYSFLESNRVVPVVVLKKTEDTVPTLSALKRCGINAAEITFRTECAAEAIALAVREFPDMLIGAGTVTDAAQCEKAYEAGAKFIVNSDAHKPVNVGRCVYALNLIGELGLTDNEVVNISDKPITFRRGLTV